MNIVGKSRSFLGYGLYQVKVLKVLEGESSTFVSVRLRVRVDPTKETFRGEHMIAFKFPFNDSASLRLFAAACGHEEAVRPGGYLDAGLVRHKRPLVLLHSEYQSPRRTKVTMRMAFPWPYAL